MKKVVSLCVQLFIIVSIAYGQDQVVKGKLTTTGTISAGEDVPDKMGEGARLYLKGMEQNTDHMYLVKYSGSTNKTDLRVNIGDDEANDDRFVVGNVRSIAGASWRDLFVVTNKGYVGINGIAYPLLPLDVNGHMRSDVLTIGKQGTVSGDNSINRLYIKPYRHTGIWEINARDVGSNAFLDLGYSSNMLISIKHSKKVGILTDDPQSALDVNGDIRGKNLHVAGMINAREVKIEINAGADFVFAPDYNLRSLSEVEAFVKENRHLPEIPSEKQMQDEGLSINDMQIKLLQKIEELTLYVIQLDKENKELKQENKKIIEQLNLISGQ